MRGSDPQAPTYLGYERVLLRVLSRCEFLVTLKNSTRVTAGRLLSADHMVVNMLEFYMLDPILIPLSAL